MSSQMIRALEDLEEALTAKTGYVSKMRKILAAEFRACECGHRYMVGLDYEGGCLKCGSMKYEVIKRWE